MNLSRRLLFTALSIAEIFALCQYESFKIRFLARPHNFLEVHLCKKATAPAYSPTPIRAWQASHSSAAAAIAIGF